MESSLCPTADIATDPDFRLIETFGWNPNEGARHLDRHLARMAASANELGMPFDREEACKLTMGLSGSESLRCRLVLDVAGRLELTHAPLGATPDQWVISIATDPLSSASFWLRHKTTRRAQYDAARAALPQGVDEVLFLNEKEELCEGTITSIFVTLPGEGMVTPPLSSGLLPGVLRSALLENGQATERVVTVSDLQHAEKIHVGNSLRGLIQANLAT